VERGVGEQPEFECFYRLLADSANLAELSDVDKNRFLKVEVAALTVYCLVYMDEPEKHIVIEDHFAMVAADADAVRHSRFTDKRVNYQRLVGPLLTDEQDFDFNFNEISQSLPKFSLAAAESLLHQFGPGALKLQELLI
jgi:hypothetical protein